MAEPVGSWIGAAVTAAVAIVAAAWALTRRLLSTVTRDELITMLEKMESNHEGVMRALEERHEKKIDEMRGMILTLHEDNKDSRHRLRDSLASPVNKLNVEIIRLRETLDRQRSSGA